MLLKNLNTAEGLVNGARGVVTGFERSKGRSVHFPMLPVVEFAVVVGGKRGVRNMVVVDEVWDLRVGDRYGEGGDKEERWWGMWGGYRPICTRHTTISPHCNLHTYFYMSAEWRLVAVRFPSCLPGPFPSTSLKA